MLGVIVMGWFSKQRQQETINTIKNNILTIKIYKQEYINNFNNHIKVNKIFYLERKWNKTKLIMDPLE